MKKQILILLAVTSCYGIFGQDKSIKFSRWYLKPAAGINIPITNVLSGEITDDLMEYDDHSYYWQILSGNYFFLKNWGIEFTFQAASSINIKGRAGRFNENVTEIYDDEYFVNPGSGAQYNDDFNIISGNFEKGYFGVVYRFEKPRFILLPKMMIGVTSFYTDWGSADLKEKGTNTVLKLSYEPVHTPFDHFTLAPAFTFGCRIAKRLLVNLDFLYSYYKTNIEYTEEIRNPFNEEISKNTIDYKKNIHTLSIGLGLIVDLKPAGNLDPREK
jgi:hypothetical protein